MPLGFIVNLVGTFKLTIPRASAVTFYYAAYTLQSWDSEVSHVLFFTFKVLIVPFQTFVTCQAE